MQDAAITDAEAAGLGQEALAVFVTDLRECIAAGRSTSIDPRADAIALCAALRGLAHQRAVASLFP